MWRKKSNSLEMKHNYTNILINKKTMKWKDERKMFKFNEDVSKTLLMSIYSTMV